MHHDRAQTPKASAASRRDFLKTSTAATIGLGMMPNAHAAGSDSIKVGLIGCGGRGTGAAENICEAAGTVLQHQDSRHGRRVRGPPEELPRACAKTSEHCKDKFDVADDRCFVGFDAYKRSSNAATW